MTAALLSKNTALRSTIVTFFILVFVCLFLLTLKEVQNYIIQKQPPRDLMNNSIPYSLTRPAITGSNLTIETLEQEVK